MLGRVLDTLPPSLRQNGETLLEEARARAETARSAARRLRADGELRAFDAGVDVLGRFEATLARGRDLPVVGAVLPRAEALVHAGQERLAGVPIEGYDALNVKQIGERLPDLSRFDLLRVRHHEGVGKKRKTVLDGVARELARRDAPQG